MIRAWCVGVEEGTSVQESGNPGVSDGHTVNDDSFAQHRSHKSQCARYGVKNNVSECWSSWLCVVDINEHKSR